MKHPNGQAMPGQVWSGQVRHAKLSGSENTYTTFRHVIQKLPTKIHVKRVIGPRVITVDTQIASEYLSIFATYLHI